MPAGTTLSAFKRPSPRSHLREALFIGGAWQPARSPERIEVSDSGTEDILGTVPSGTVEEVDAAVAAARGAFDDWSRTAPPERARHLRALHEKLSARRDLLASLISAEVGTAIRMSAAIQVGGALSLLEATANSLTDLSFAEHVGNSTVVREPIGIVAAITPWNYPLFQTIAKVAAALAAGCTVIHKPSGLAPLSAFILADAVEEAALPRGVYNLVTGAGAVIGEALASHAGVDMVSFTGSTSSGTRVYELAARSIKKVALELGGKSASIVLDDSALPAAIKASVNNAFLNSGQTCNAWTRLLVPTSKQTEAVELAVAAVENLTLGDQFDPATRLGPLVSAAQLATVRRYVEGALRSGATLAAGGPERPPGSDRGHYFRATVLTRVTRDMTVAQEEVFGPVLCVMTYGSDDEAVEIANSTQYGLSGGVWSGDVERALSVARRVRAGQIDINGGRFNLLAPQGGHKKSGVGRELGRYGIEEFLQLKALQM